MQVAPPLRNRETARLAARAARASPFLFRRAGERRGAETGAGHRARFLWITIRFFTFPLRGLLARRGALTPAAALRTATQAHDKPGGGRGRRLVNLEEPRFLAPTRGTNQKTQA